MGYSNLHHSITTYRTRRVFNHTLSCYHSEQEDDMEMWDFTRIIKG